MQLKDILKVAEDTFEKQVAKAGSHPECHEAFFELRLGGVLAHVYTQCAGKPNMTEELVARCVRRQWPLTKIRAALAKMAPSSAPSIVYSYVVLIIR